MIPGAHHWHLSEVAAPFMHLHEEADPIAWLEQRESHCFREREGRRTFCFEHAGSRWFAKVHRGVGLWALLEQLAVLRLPVFDAGTERRAAKALQAAGVATLEVVAWGWSGSNPLRRRSFVITRAIEYEATLEARLRSGLLSAPERRRLLVRVAQLVRRMHAAGINHRDLFLVHLLHTADDALHLIDLHRAEQRRRVPRRWLSKDLAALAFSAAAAGPLGRRDRLRFLRAYRQRPLRVLLAEEARLWADVERRTQRMVRRGPRG